MGFQEEYKDIYLKLRRQQSNEYSRQYYLNNKEALLKKAKQYRTKKKETAMKKTVLEHKLNNYYKSIIY